MELPASLREINPLIDAIARGEDVPHDGAGPRLAVALGLVTPGHSLTAAGRAYACPASAVGPLALVMSPGRRAAAEPLLGGRLPLQATLRRLLRQVAAQGDHLVSPLALGWPEALLRPYLAYLEDLGLLVPIGPLVEVTPRGRAVAGWPAPADAADPGPWGAAAKGAGGEDEGRAPTPHWSSPVFRYHLVRQVCLTLLTLRGRREWHKLEPLLEGPLLSLKPAYTEWLARFQAAQPAMRRSWHPCLVEQFAQREPAPPWFSLWCKALLDTEPEGAADALAQTPALLHDPALLGPGEGPASREGWLVATALAWAARRGRTLKYAEAAARFRLDGVQLPAWPAMQQSLEEAGLLVTELPCVQLLLPVEVQAPAGALWPYAGPEWVAAALLEGGAFAVAAGVRRPERV